MYKHKLISSTTHPIQKPTTTRNAAEQPRRKLRRKKIDLTLIVIAISSCPMNFKNSISTASTITKRRINQFSTSCRIYREKKVHPVKRNPQALPNKTPIKPTVQAATLPWIASTLLT
jgi:hypothetical protein